MFIFHFLRVVENLVFDLRSACSVQAPFGRKLLQTSSKFAGKGKFQDNSNYRNNTLILIHIILYPEKYLDHPTPQISSSMTPHKKWLSQISHFAPVGSSFWAGWGCAILLPGSKIYSFGSNPWVQTVLGAKSFSQWPQSAAEHHQQNP